jgi:Flp pilus assembly protein CpaB
LRRSNRLVLLVGVFLAVVAFVGILLLSGSGGIGGGTPRQSQPPTEGPVVVATTDIPLSTRITADQLTTKVIAISAMLPGAFTDVSQAIGQIARQPVATGGQVTQTTITGGTTGTVIDVQVPVGQRAIAMRVDQISGVGTVIKTGDYVDAVIALSEEQFASVVADPANRNQVVVTNPGPKGTTVKLILQGMQVLGTLLPPVAPPPTTAGATPAPTAGGPAVALNEQQEIVILSVTAQQAEVVRYGQQMANPLLTWALILRSPDDFIDPVTGQAITPPVEETTGVTLRTLVDTYDVLPPTIVTPILPVLSPAPTNR